MHKDEYVEAILPLAELNSRLSINRTSGGISNNSKMHENAVLPTDSFLEFMNLLSNADAPHSIGRNL